MSHRSARGFTLVEVLVAMAILLVGLLGTAGLVTRATAKSASARKLTEGQLVALSVLERLRAEVRFDAEPGGESCSGAANRDCIGDGPFVPAQAWMAERLPYSSTDVVAGTGSCNPAPVDDGVLYDVGPLPVRHEGSTFRICYRLDPAAGATPGVPANSLDARIKVLWQTPDGWDASWLSAILLDGR